jgi:hypothetical protein
MGTDPGQVGHMRQRRVILAALLLLLIVMVMSGCGRYTTSVIPPQGFLFTHIKAPLTSEFDNTPAGLRHSRVSQSSTYYLRDFIFTGLDIAWGDVSIEYLQRTSGMKQIYFADYEYLNVLGIYAQFTINLYGATD